MLNVIDTSLTLLVLRTSARVSLLGDETIDSEACCSIGV